MLKKFTRTVLVLAPALALALSALTPYAALGQASCGGPGEKLCKSVTSCVYLKVGSRCTTTYDYWADPPEIPEEA